MHTKTTLIHNNITCVKMDQISNFKKLDNIIIFIF